MKRILVSIGAAVIIPFLAWTMGFNFNERGAAAFGTSVYTLLVFFFTYYYYPGWKDN